MCGSGSGGRGSGSYSRKDSGIGDGGGSSYSSRPRATSERFSIDLKGWVSNWSCPDIPHFNPTLNVLHVYNLYIDIHFR